MVSLIAQIVIFISVVWWPVCAISSFRLFATKRCHAKGRKDEKTPCEKTKRRKKVMRKDEIAPCKKTKFMEAYRDPPNNQIYLLIVTCITQYKVIYSSHGARVLTTNVIISEYIDQFWLSYVLKFE